MGRVLSGSAYGVGAFVPGRAPDETLTRTEAILSRLPLPLGYEGTSKYAVQPAAQR